MLYRRFFGELKWNEDDFGQDAVFMGVWKGGEQLKKFRGSLLVEKNVEGSWICLGAFQFRELFLKIMICFGFTNLTTGDT